jgi:hypothetical protein
MSRNLIDKLIILHKKKSSPLSFLVAKSPASKREMKL